MCPQPNPPPARAALYVRVSTEGQVKEGYSLGEQEYRGRQVAEREGWDATVTPTPPALVPIVRAPR